MHQHCTVTLLFLSHPSALAGPYGSAVRPSQFVNLDALHLPNRGSQQDRKKNCRYQINSMHFLLANVEYVVIVSRQKE